MVLPGPRPPVRRPRTAGSTPSATTTTNGSTLRNAGRELDGGTVEEFSQRLFAERSWGQMAESETYAHLEHLHLAGQAERWEEDDFLRYRVG